MLFKMIERLLTRKRQGARRHAPAKEELLIEATELMAHGDNRGAIKLLRSFLDADPSNVVALNSLGTCLADIGDNRAASEAFELAYSLDDTYVPAMVNRAKFLVDHRRTTEALPFLERAKVAEPGFPFTDTIYAALLQCLGDAPRARAYQKKSWLASFDNLRTANGHLFWMAYDDIDEAELAREHRFWAETVKTVPDSDSVESFGGRGEPDWRSRRIRIGYWSPDMRNHSVRYFFRPLLEGHDRDRFELFLYHDSPIRDAQTELIERCGDNLHPVHELSDREVRDLIRSHKLDVLVELAGHTSFNRLPLLKSRLARFQMTALGYPPTTGMSTIDFKLVDAHILTSEAEKYYAERPFPLSNTFWCFDPMEETSLSATPPQDINGYVTFGAVGNVAKITERIAHAWAEIMAALPTSRLLVRSVSFADPASISATKQRLLKWGLPMTRVELVPPKGGKDFFDSYNDIDIVLDTYPFNGGTTTCFATYMGVPVVTLAGRSLLARMGLSILTNLGSADLVVESFQDYIARAIALAQDSDRVRRFKREARQVYKSTALGNGRCFARDFESSILKLLESSDAGVTPWVSRITALDSGELLRRAYDTMRTGQPDAARRILIHCLREYPDFGPAHLLHAQLLVWEGHVQLAVEHLTEHLERFAPKDQCGAWLAILRMHLLREDDPAARACLIRLHVLSIHEPFDILQLKLYSARLENSKGESGVGADRASLVYTGVVRRAHFLIPSDSELAYQTFCEQVLSCCEVGSGWEVTFERCGEDDRIGAYWRAMHEAENYLLVISQTNVTIYSPEFLDQLARALEHLDCVSFAGARRWRSLDWRSDQFEQKSGGFLAPSSERGEMLELHFLGLEHSDIVSGMAILDGTLFALRPGRKEPPKFDDALVGCDSLLEEAWSYTAGQEGWQLGVHRNLGVFVAPRSKPDHINRVEARLACVKKQSFDPFALLREDHSSVSTPVADPQSGLRVSQAYFGSE